MKSEFCIFFSWIQCHPFTKFWLYSKGLKLSICRPPNGLLEAIASALPGVVKTLNALPFSSRHFIWGVTTLAPFFPSLPACSIFFGCFINVISSQRIKISFAAPCILHKKVCWLAQGTLFLRLKFLQCHFIFLNSVQKNNWYSNI